MLYALALGSCTPVEVNAYLFSCQDDQELALAKAWCIYLIDDASLGMQRRLDRSRLHFFIILTPCYSLWVLLLHIDMCSLLRGTVLLPFLVQRMREPCCMYDGEHLPLDHLFGDCRGGAIYGLMQIANGVLRVLAEVGYMWCVQIRGHS